MPARVSNAVCLLLPALALGLVLGGCDAAAPAGLDADEEDASSLFQSTSDLGARMTGLRKTASLTRVTPPEPSSTNGPGRVALASVTRVAPPRDTMRVGALTHADGTIYIGYKTPGAAFGGGVDRLDASDPTALLAPSSLGSDVLDVEDVARGGRGTALYVTGGLRPSAHDGELQGTPAALLKIDGVEAPRATVTGLSGPVGRGVAIASGSDRRHDVYAVSEGEALSGFDAALSNETRQEVSGATLESVTATPNAVFATDRDGGVYAGQISGDGPFAEVSGLGNGRVAQLRARSGSALNGERLFVARGPRGLAVLDAESGDALFRRPGRVYTSVSLHEDDPAVPSEPSGFVYAARPDGRLDVYQVSDRGIGTDDVSTGLRIVGTIDLAGLAGMEAPIRQVVGVGCHVYATSGDGEVVALKMGTAQGCGRGGHQLPAASADRDETTEREATATAVLANDTDADGGLDASTVQVRRTAAHGTVRVDESTGEVTYTPEPGFTGTDEYTYTVADQDGWTSGETTVTITVEALGPPPPPGG